MQTDLKNQIRGLLKVFGIVLQRGHSQSFEQQVTRNVLVRLGLESVVQLR